MTNKSLNKYLCRVTLAISGLAACGGEENLAKPGQVVAKVNGEEISIHQLNFLLAKSGLAGKENVKIAGKQLLNSLIDQSLIEQKAIEDELDRNPNVMLAMEQAKRQALTQAWLEQAIKVDAAPTDQEVSSYYNDHPELFKNRKIYKLKELFIKISPEHRAAVEKLINHSARVDELVGRLDAGRITYDLNLETQPAENLPLESLPALQKLKDGEFITIKKDNGVLVLGVLASVDEGVNETKAAPFIKKFLSNLQLKANAENTLKKLHRQATIEYLGDFTALNQAVNATGPDASSDARTTHPGNESAQDVIGKGVSELK
ncbi:MAG: EpsD family peptidyl-prolyl cis-trans isomerase [Methylococcales bacterium]